ASMLEGAVEPGEPAGSALRAIRPGWAGISGGLAAADVREIAAGLSAEAADEAPARGAVAPALRPAAGAVAAAVAVAASGLNASIRSSVISKPARGSGAMARSRRPPSAIW